MSSAAHNMRGSAIMVKIMQSPNQTLADARMYARKADEAATHEKQAENANWSLDSYRSLDEWVSNGGFLPSEWVSS